MTTISPSSGTPVPASAQPVEPVTSAMRQFAGELQNLTPSAAGINTPFYLAQQISNSSSGAPGEFQLFGGVSYKHEIDPDLYGRKDKVVLQWYAGIKSAGGELISAPEPVSGDAIIQGIFGGMGLRGAHDVVHHLATGSAVNFKNQQTGQQSNSILGELINTSVNAALNRWDMANGVNIGDVATHAPQIKHAAHAVSVITEDNKPERFSNILSVDEARDYLPLRGEFELKQVGADEVRIKSRGIVEYALFDALTQMFNSHPEAAKELSDMRINMVKHFSEVMEAYIRGATEYKGTNIELTAETSRLLIETYRTGMQKAQHKLKNKPAADVLREQIFFYDSLLGNSIDSNGGNTSGPGLLQQLMSKVGLGGQSSGDNTQQHKVEQNLSEIRAHQAQQLSEYQQRQKEFSVQQTPQFAQSGPVRDPITTQYFNGENITIKYNGQEVGDDFELEFQGKKFSRDDIIRLSGGIDGSNIVLSKELFGHQLFVKVSHSLLSEPYKLFLYSSKSEPMTLEIKLLKKLPGAPEKLGARMVVNTLLAAQQLGIEPLVFAGAKTSEYVGSGYWFSLGFGADTALDGEQRNKLPFDVRSQFATVGDVLASYPEADKWLHSLKRGGAYNFDTTPGSRSWQFLNRFLEKHDIRLGVELPVTATADGHNLTEAQIQQQQQQSQQQIAQQQYGETPQQSQQAEQGPSQPGRNRGDRWAHLFSGQQVPVRADGQIDGRPYAPIEFHGLKLLLDAFARLAGAPDRSAVWVTDIEPDSIKFKLYNNHLFDMPPEFTLIHDDNGKNVLHFASIYRSDKGNGAAGLAVRMIIKTIINAAALGIDEVQMVAGRYGSGVKSAGASEEQGYRVWPRVGADAELNLPLKSRLNKALRPEEKIELGYDADYLPEEVKNANTVQDLLQTPLGKKWWRLYGTDIHLTVDLKPGSRSWEVLQQTVDKLKIADQHVRSVIAQKIDPALAQKTQQSVHGDISQQSQQPQQAPGNADTLKAIRQQQQAQQVEQQKMQQQFGGSIQTVSQQPQSGPVRDPTTAQYFNGENITVTFNGQKVGDDFVFELEGKQFSRNDIIRLSGGIDDSNITLDDISSGKQYKILVDHPEMSEQYVLQLTGFGGDMILEIMSLYMQPGAPDKLGARIVTNTLLAAQQSGIQPSVIAAAKSREHVGIGYWLSLGFGAEVILDEDEGLRSSLPQGLELKFTTVGDVIESYPEAGNWLRSLAVYGGYDFDTGPGSRSWHFLNQFLEKHDIRLGVELPVTAEPGDVQENASPQAEDGLGITTDSLSDQVPGESSSALVEQYQQYQGFAESNNLFNLADQQKHPGYTNFSFHKKIENGPGTIGVAPYNLPGLLSEQAGDLTTPVESGEGQSTQTEYQPAQLVPATFSPKSTRPAESFPEQARLEQVLHNAYAQLPEVVQAALTLEEFRQLDFTEIDLGQQYKDYAGLHPNVTHQGDKPPMRLADYIKFGPEIQQSLQHWSAQAKRSDVEINTQLKQAQVYRGQAASLQQLTRQIQQVTAALKAARSEKPAQRAEHITMPSRYPAAQMVPEQAGNAGSNIISTAQAGAPIGGKVSTNVPMISLTGKTGLGQYTQSNTIPKYLYKPNQQGQLQLHVVTESGKRLSLQAVPLSVYTPQGNTGTHYTPESGWQDIPQLSSAEQSRINQYLQQSTFMLPSPVIAPTTPAASGQGVPAAIPQVAP